VSIFVRGVLVVALLATVVLLMRTVTASVSVEVIGLTHEDNPRWWADRPVNNQPSAACADCHDATTEATTASAHATVNCDSCHGAAREHIDLARSGQEAPLALADGRDLCTTCHAGLDSRPEGFPQVDAVTHGAPANGVTSSCTSCHNPHDPGFPTVIKHALEGRSDCLVCHGPDEWQPVPPSHRDRSGDGCLECHSPGEGA
jgi:predicted CXXCH cytochrome family protein